MTDAAAGPGPQPFTAKALMAEEIPPVRWVVPGMLPEGLTILAGRPKIGKSWLVLDLGLTAATGGRVLGHIQLDQSEVLCLALEDSKRRLQERLTTLLARDSANGAPEALVFGIQWHRFDAGGLVALDRYLTEHPEVRLVIIDPFERVRRKRRPNANLYAEDYAAAQELKAVADKHHVAILVVHHLRKAEADDPIELVNGSTGLTAAADTILVLKRQRGQAAAVLYATGRDIDEQELALGWDNASCHWSLLGSASDFRLSPERDEIRRVLAEAGKPLFPKEVAEALGKDHNAVKQLLWKMANDGQVKLAGSGRYTIDNSTNRGKGGNSGNSGNQR